jgi:hypothetical protein
MIHVDQKQTGECEIFQIPSQPGNEVQRDLDCHGESVAYCNVKVQVYVQQLICKYEDKR